jgi:predicted ATPase
MPSHNTTPPQRGAWRIELLGGLRAQPLSDDGSGRGEPVTQFRTHKAALLLARLALFPHRAHAREELAELLWPDAPADRGRASLTQTLVYLRQALHQPRTGGLFIADHRTVRLAQNAVQTDVAQWEADASRAFAMGSEPREQAALVQATLAAYPGDFLPGFYDGWVSDERSRLAELRSALQARLHILQSAATSNSPALLQKTTRATAEQDGSVSPLFVNAPLFLTRFFGRAFECETVCGLLRHDPFVRLITLLGMGGIGKTRLAVEIAQTVTRDTAVFDWAAFVPLDQALTAEHMESSLLSVLGVENKEADGLTAVAKYLNVRVVNRDDGKKRLLLVLDNLEQLGDVSAPVVARLLVLVPRLTIMTTSRQPVGVAGEQEIPLGPLSDGREGNRETPDAVRLFVDRARLVRPAFVLTSENQAVIYQLGALLEGVPLALELAAAWLRVLTPAQIADRLSNRFGLLKRQGTGSGSTIPKRHQSLHAAIAWSYDLLGSSLQAFWAQLSVFRGGWTTAAAQAVTGRTEISEPLLLLTERSLILAETEEATGEVRYRMLESLREFAEEQAMGSEYYATLCLRHAQYFEELSRQGEQIIQVGSGNRPAMVLLGPERDNIRAALRFTLETPTEPDQAKELVLATGIRLALHSASLRSLFEQAAYLEQAAGMVVSLPDDTGLPLRAQVLSQQGLIATLWADYPTAKRKITEGLALWEALGDEQESITSKKRLSGIAWRTGNATEALSLLVECLDAARKINAPIVEASILNNLAVCGSGRPERWDWITQSVALYRQHMPHSFFMAAALNSMGGIALQNGDFETAQPYLEEAHDLSVAEGSPGMIGVAKEMLARLFLATGEHLDRAALLLQETQRIFEEKGEPPRVAEAHLLSFHVALKRGDGEAALSHARDYLRVNRDAALMDAPALASAQADLASKLGSVGYETHAGTLF